MEKLLSNLDAEWKANKELGLITSVADSLVKDGFNARILSDKKNGLLTTNTELVNVEDTFEIVFNKKDSMYSYIIIKGEGKIRECKNLQGIIIDADSLGLIGNRRVFLNNKGDKEPRAHIKVCGHSIKLHRFLLDAKNNKEVDHITHRSHIVIKEMLRKCTAEQNSINKLPKKPKVNLENRTFTVERIKPTAEDIKAIREAGHTIDIVPNDARGIESSVYSISSKVFDNEVDLYEEFNKLENKFFGQFRYNPIYAFKDVEIYGVKKFSGLIWTYLYMQVKLLGLDEDEFIRLRKAFLKEYCPDMCDYYGIS